MTCCEYILQFIFQHFLILLTIFIGPIFILFVTLHIKILHNYKMEVFVLTLSGSFVGYFGSFSRETAMPEITSAFVTALLGGFLYHIFVSKTLKGETSKAISLCIMFFLFSLFVGSSIGAHNREDYETFELPKKEVIQEKIRILKKKESFPIN